MLCNNVLTQCQYESHLNIIEQNYGATLGVCTYILYMNVHKF